MTNETLSAKLDAVLDPLNAISLKVTTALDLAQRNRLPRSFIQTIRDSINQLDAAHDQLLDIAIALDPSLAKHER